MHLFMKTTYTFASAGKHVVIGHSKWGLVKAALNIPNKRCDLSAGVISYVPYHMVRKVLALSVGDISFSTIAWIFMLALKVKNCLSVVRVWCNNLQCNDDVTRNIHFNSYSLYIPGFDSE